MKEFEEFKELQEFKGARGRQGSQKAQKHKKNREWTRSEDRKGLLFVLIRVHSRLLSAILITSYEYRI